MNIDIPEYVVQNLLHLLIILVGGLLVGWITHSFFARKAAIAEVEGEVMKKRLSIYEELYKRLSSLLAQEILPTERIQLALSAIKDLGEDVPQQSSVPTLVVMNTASEFTDAYMQLDQFITNNRLYYETEVDKAILYFTNYIAIYRRLQVMYEEQIIDMNISISEENIARQENLLITEISILFQEELAAEITKVLTVLKSTLSTPMLHKRKPQDHGFGTFGEDGSIIQNLSNTKLFQKREFMRKLITANIAQALATQKLKKRK